MELGQSQSQGWFRVRPVSGLGLGLRLGSGLVTGRCCCVGVCVPLVCARAEDHVVGVLHAIWWSAGTDDCLCVCVWAYGTHTSMPLHLHAHTPMHPCTRATYSRASLHTTPIHPYAHAPKHLNICTPIHPHPLYTHCPPIHARAEVNGVARCDVPGHPRGGTARLGAR